MAEVSTKPYLIRAIYDWCTDSGFTPHVAVAVDQTVRVPAEFVSNGEIVLNVSALATSRLLIDNEAISFQARFGGVPREVYAPMGRIVAVYARENGQGMAFPMPIEGGARSQGEAERPTPPARGLRLARAEPEQDNEAPVEAPVEATHGDTPPDPDAPGTGRPSLKRVK